MRSHQWREHTVNINIMQNFLWTHKIKFKTTRPCYIAAIAAAVYVKRLKEKHNQWGHNIAATTSFNAMERRLRENKKKNQPKARHVQLNSIIPPNFEIKFIKWVELRWSFDDLTKLWSCRSSLYWTVKPLRRPRWYFREKFHLTKPFLVCQVEFLYETVRLLRCWQPSWV